MSKSAILQMSHYATEPYSGIERFNIVYNGNFEPVDPTNPNGLWTLMSEIEIVKYENGVAEQKNSSHIISQ